MCVSVRVSAGNPTWCHHHEKGPYKAYLPYLTKKKFNLLSSREMFASVKGFLEEAISISMQGDF